MEEDDDDDEEEDGLYTDDALTQFLIHQAGLGVTTGQDDVNVTTAVPQVLPQAPVALLPPSVQDALRHVGIPVIVRDKSVRVEDLDPNVTLYMAGWAHQHEQLLGIGYQVYPPVRGSDGNPTQMIETRAKS
jgi:hypothetical protein